MGSRRSKRVSWAAGANLCKVRLFLSEDSPSQAGLRPQNNLQAKGSWLMHAAGPSSDDSLPPGFESLQPTNDFKIDISQIPLIRWRCPPQILYNPDWLVVAGEESEEAAIQNERIFGALEAIYPRPSNIPPNPFVTPDVKDSHYDDSRTQLVPLIPVEEDDASDQLEEQHVEPPNIYHHSEKYDSAITRVPQASDAPFTTAQQQPNCSMNARSAGISAEPDIVAAASAAYTAIMQSNQMGNMIDQDLLIKILSDPAQLERLMKEYGTLKHEQAINSSVVAPMVSGPPPQMTATVPTSFPDHVTTFHNINPTVPPPPPAMNHRLPPAIPSVPLNPPASSNQAINFLGAPGKGLNYYKTLIHQHGGERQEPVQQHGLQYAMHHQSVPLQTSTIDVSNSTMPGRDSKHRPAKPCAYFNSARGCRNGANCTFLHDVSAARKEQPQGSKRIKLDSRIAGRY